MEKKELIKKHIEALEKGYENLIEILNEDIDRDEETDKIALKDDKIKAYADGIKSAANTATDLLEMITDKKAELQKIISEESTEVIPLKVEKEANEDYPTRKHLK